MQSICGLRTRAGWREEEQNRFINRNLLLDKGLESLGREPLSDKRLVSFQTFWVQSLESPSFFKSQIISSLDTMGLTGTHLHGVGFD